MPAEIDEGYFNDLSRQPNQSHESSLSPPEQAANHSPNDQSELPKTKRIACVICRKRKLKCDGNKPKCATCARLGHNCQYDEVRRKSGPKRGYVKELEARLAQVETQLKGKAARNGKKAPLEKQPSMPEDNAMNDAPPPHAPQGVPSIPSTTSIPSSEAPFNVMGSSESPFSPSTMNPLPEAVNNGSDFMPDMSFGLDDNFSWEMIGLGLEEPLPTQDAIDELTNVYFEKIHPSLPVLHKYRYYSSLSLAPQARPPVCLRYIMWALAAVVTDKYMHHDDIFYRRARKYLELDEMKGAGEATVSLAHAQAWVLVATYEFKLMYFPRAWMSVGRGSRMVLMMGLNRIDGIGIDVKQCLAPPKDWVEKEERRRTFWMAYCVDRYASIGTGWPMSVDEKDIMTALPASEEAYENGTPQTTCLMGQAMSQEQIATMSTFAGVIYVTHFFGLNLTHLHRPEPDDDESNLQGKFWKRHRYMDNILSNTSLALPSHLRLPMGVRNPNVVFINFSLHTSTICLHQAAIFKAQRHNVHQSAVENCRGRCLLAAAEIANIMRMTSHLDITGMNPYMVFCLYVAARVFVQYLKSSPQDEEIKHSLEFLLTAMAALRRKVPLAESFMIQLQLDIEGNGLDILLHNPDFSSMVKDKANTHLQNCPIINNDKKWHSETRHGDSVFPKQSAVQPGPDTIDYQAADPWKSACGQPTNSPSPIVPSRSPQDFRVPDTWKTNPSRSPLNAPSPNSTTSNPDQRQTSYTLNSMDLSASVGASTDPYYPSDHLAGPGVIPGILPGSSHWRGAWSANDNVLNSVDAPVGMNPILNNNIGGSNPFDTDMGGSDQSGPSRHGSTGLTPQSTHSAYGGTSSNTSYSPPNMQDDDPTISAAQRANSIPATMEETLKVPPGWDTGASPRGTGMTPGSGMTPGFSGMGSMSEWEQMMREVNWEGSGMTPGSG